jgi:sec-independent protein translocase protein TatA
MLGGIGSTELLLVVGLVLIVFGPKKLPEIGRSLGKGLKEFKQATRELKESIDFDADEEDKKTTIGA